MKLDVQKTGFTVGLFLGGWHVVWSLLVALGWGQALYDFILWAHMVHLAIVVGPFDIGAAAVLIMVTALIGYAFGVVFALVWNWLHRAGQ